MSASLQGENAPAQTSAQTPAEDADAPRRSVLDNLSDYLETGTVLLNQCAHLSALPNGDRVKPLFAASRLMSAQARVAEVLATIHETAQVRKAIVEHYQFSRAQKPDSNSILNESEESAIERELRLKMLRIMALHAEEGFDDALKEADREKAMRAEAARRDAEYDTAMRVAAARDEAKHDAPP